MNAPASTRVPTAAQPAGLPLPRDYGAVNWIGVQTLYLKECRRFWKVGLQTVAAPVVTTLLYMMIFVVAMNGATPLLEGVSYARFVTPGLVMMALLNNAFANSSSSLIQMKMNGTAPDILTPPLSPLEHLAGFALGAASRGVLVGAVTALAVWPFAPFGVAHPLAVLYFGLCAALMMGCLGIVAGLWSQKFDHLAAVTNFVVMPMTFLSGTFYLIERLPEPFRTATQFNPMFYLIDGFRFGFIGRAEGPVMLGAAVVGLVTLALAAWAWSLFRSGWRLQS
jgi:ABC-2 type transport system permease protein